jgi:hypothetical protein
MSASHDFLGLVGLDFANEWKHAAGDSFLVRADRIKELRRGPLMLKLTLGTVLIIAAVNDGGCEPTPVEPTGDAMPPAPDAGRPPLTYWKDIKPIVDGRCVPCHKPGGAGPFPLDTALAVLRYSPAIANAVFHRRMPPWMAKSGCNEYLHDRSLTQAQINRIVRWEAEGAPEGDPANQGPPLPPVGVDMERVDLRLKMPEAYTPQKRPDDIRCFVFEWPETKSRYITGIGVSPGVVPLVHHAIPYLIQARSAAGARSLDSADPAPGYNCSGERGLTDRTWLTSWEPGGRGVDFPHGTGILIEPGSVIVLQVHYNTAYREPEPDQTTVEVALADSVPTPATPQVKMDFAWLGGRLPPNANNVRVTYVTPKVTVESKVHWADVHMHTRGTVGYLAVERANGSQECLLDARPYNFNWQETFLLKNPVALMPGDALRVECEWSNPEPREIRWGESTSDEMCLGNFLISEKRPPPAPDAGAPDARASDAGAAEAAPPDAAPPDAAPRDDPPDAGAPDAGP